MTAIFGKPLSDYLYFQKEFLVAAAALAMAGATAQTDLYAGTWMLNVARTGGESRTQTLTIEIQGDQESYRSELAWPGGRRQVTSYVAKYDEEEYPSQTVITENPGESGSVRNDTVVLRKIDERTRERYWKQDGRLVRILRRVVSADGNTLTSQVVDVDERGRERVTSTLIFDKQ